MSYLVVYPTCRIGEISKFVMQSASFPALLNNSEFAGRQMQNGYVCFFGEPHILKRNHTHVYAWWLAAFDREHVVSVDFRRK